ncbi:MAG: hypothetical protein U0269_10220 [Polyangiales bacterium]
MSERCDRCRKGFGSNEPKDDIEWLLGSTTNPSPGQRQLRVARCTRCSSYLVDVVSCDRERAELVMHDVCVVQHESARAALLDRTPLALAALSPQLRRRHLEELSAEMPTRDRDALGWIEQGSVACTELFRALVTRVFALSTPDLPKLSDVRPRTWSSRKPGAAVPPRSTLELDDGSRVVTQSAGDRTQLVRLRGDRVLWRADLEGAGRDTFVARARNTNALVIVALATPSDGGGALAYVIDAEGAVRGPARHEGRASAFEAISLSRGCVFVAGYQSQMVLREDASIAWQAPSATVANAVSFSDSVQVIEPPWKLVSLALPDGSERWSLPVDKNAQIAPSGDGHVLVASSDVVARVDVRSPKPSVRWIAQGANALPLRSGGVALVRDRWEKAGRRIECIVIDAEGRRRFSVARPESTKAPTAELGNGVLLYHSGSDVAISANERVTYAVTVPEGRTASVTLEDGGAWIEYDGIVDRIDPSGRRVARYRVG